MGTRFSFEAENSDERDEMLGAFGGLPPSVRGRHTIKIQPGREPGVFVETLYVQKRPCFSSI